jgi:hypothetical protein
MSGLLQDCCNQRPSKTWLKLKNPESAAVRLGARGGVALASAHPSSAQIENPTNRLKIVQLFEPDLSSRAAPSYVPHSRLPPLEAFGRRPPNSRCRPSCGRHPKPFTLATEIDFPHHVRFAPR